MQVVVEYGLSAQLQVLKKVEKIRCRTETLEVGAESRLVLHIVVHFVDVWKAFGEARLVLGKVVLGHFVDEQVGVGERVAHTPAGLRVRVQLDERLASVRRTVHIVVQVALEAKSLQQASDNQNENQYFVCDLKVDFSVLTFSCQFI